jgi:hypothetical protein
LNKLAELDWVSGYLMVENVVRIAEVVKAARLRL